MKLKLFIILLILSLESIYSEDVKFFNVSKLYGTSIHDFFSLCKDSNGFIWASSRSEIIRLSIDDYKVYNLPYAKKEAIIVKIICNGGELLAYTSSGQIFRYNAILDRFDYLPKYSNINRWINKMLIADDDSYWIATRTGLFGYKNEELIFSDNVLSVQEIVQYNKGKLIFACDGVINILNTDNMAIEQLCSLPQNTSLVSKIYYDGIMQRLWIGMLTGELYYYDFSVSAIKKFHFDEQPKQPVLAIESNTDSTLLVGIDGKGIYVLNKNGGRVISKYEENVDDPYSLLGNGVYDIMYDKQSERVWVCTVTGGVSFYKQSLSPVTQLQHQINNSNSLQNNHVNQIIEDSMGKLWFATDNGVSCLDIKTGNWRFYHQNEKEQSKVFLSLCEDDDKRIWAGTYSSGIYLFDSRTGKEIAHYSRSTHEPASDFVFDIYKDCDGDIWIGGNQNEVIRYTPKDKQFRSYGFWAVSAFADLDSARILLACSNGLLSIDKRTGESEQLISDYMMQDVLVYKSDAWICTIGQGLLRYNLKNKDLQKITVQAGLSSDYANSIMLSEGYLWIGTKQGLCRVNPDDNTVVNYSSTLSLGNIMFYRNANCRLHDGKLAFGTGNGAIIFNPSMIKQIPTEGQIFFQDILVNGRSIRNNVTLMNNTPVNELRRISLKYNQNNIAIELFPMSLESECFKFSWKMEGIDEDWSQISSLRKINYTNIPAGTYNWAIIMYDNSMTRVAERSIEIIVTPPFWATWQFRMLMTLALFTLVFCALRFYINRLKNKHTEEKIKFFANMTHDIRNILTLITAPVEEMNRNNDFSNADRYYLYLVRQQVRRLSMTATHLLDFQKTDIGKGQLSLVMTDIAELIDKRIKMFESTGKSKSVELEFTNLSPDYVSAIDEVMIENVIDNLISNAIKYSFQNGKVSVLFKGNDKSWFMEIKDHGIGMNRQTRKKLFKEFYRGENAVNSNITGSGLGLLLAKNYISLHKGVISCESKENQGSIFKISVPYKKVYAPVSEPSVSSNDISSANRISEQQNLNILIVEDNDDLRNFMYHSLSGMFNASLAKDGLQAWDMIKKQTPDLVVSDVLMPNLDGFELCRLLKSTFETSHIPVVLLTALTEKAQQLHGLKLGADDYLTKPFDMHLLVEKINTIVRNRKTCRNKALKLINAKQDDCVFENELNDKFMKKAIEVVRLNIANSEFGKEEFASAMNVSSSLLYKKIKSFTDQSVVDFINSIRLNYAMELLQSKKHTITEVGYLCGYTSLKYFSASFKKYFGKTPSEIR